MTLFVTAPFHNTPFQRQPKVGNIKPEEGPLPCKSSKATGLSLRLSQQG